MIRRFLDFIGVDPTLFSLEVEAKREYFVILAEVSGLDAEVLSSALHVQVFFRKN